MSNKEKIVENLRMDLQPMVESYFDSIEKFENQFILNSRITKGSPFEKSTFCSNFTIYNLNEIPITEIILGDCEEIILASDIRIATSGLKPKEGKELNSWSSSIFGITINAEVSFNQETKSIEVLKVKVRSR